MANLYYGRVYGSAPYPSAEINYEYSRDGADMLYHFWGRIYLESSGGWYYNNLQLCLYLNGGHIHTSNHKSSNKGWSSSFDAGWHRISNKTSGTTPFYFTVKDTQNSGWCNFTSGTFNLAVSPAYFTSTPNLWVHSYDENSVTYGWSTPQTCNWIRYYKDGSSSYTDVGNPNATSGYFNVPNWGVNQQHRIYIQARRADSGLWSNSGNVYCTTHDYPKPTSMNNFIIGNGASVNLLNPLGRSCKLEILQKDTNKVLGMYSGTANGTINAEFKTADAINKQYASIPNSKTGTYYCKVTYGSSVKTLDDGSNHTYRIAESDAEKPTFNSDKITGLVNLLHTDINGNSKFIKGHNRLQGTISPMTGNKSAGVDKGYYSISSNGIESITKNYSISNQNFTLDNLTSDSVVISAVDNRGMARSASKNVSMIDYFNPYLSKVDITRQNGTGVYAIVKLAGKYTNWTGLTKSNKMQTIKYRYKLVTSTTWSEWTAFPSGSAITNSNGDWSITAILNTQFSNVQQYDIQFQFNDLLETVQSSSYIVSTANALLWRDLANKRIGINKKPSEALDVEGNIQSSGNLKGKTLYINGTKMIWYE